MKVKKRTVISTLLIITIVLTFFCFPFVCEKAFANDSSDITSKQKELNALQQEIEETRKLLFSKKQEESHALAALENIEYELEQLQLKIAEQNNKLKTAEKELENTEKQCLEVEKQIEELKKELEMRADDIRELMVKIYKTGPGTYLEILFASSSLSELMNRYEYLNIIVKNDTDIFNSVTLQKEKVEAKQAELISLRAEQEYEKKEIEEIKRALEADEQTVVSNLKEKEFYLKRVQLEREKYEKELEEEERNSKEIEKVIKELQAKEKQTQIKGYTTSFIWPTIQGRISSPFGWRVHPILGGNKFHSGIDIAVPSGSPVYATADGKVLLAGWVNGYGNTVVIDHGGSITSLYAHNSVLKITAGKTVKKGAVIALVGSTGNSTGPHLHFEIRKNGTAQDPFNYIPSN